MHAQQSRYGFGIENPKALGECIPSRNRKSEDGATKRQDDTN
jgi:hypothetical protein